LRCIRIPLVRVRNVDDGLLAVLAVLQEAEDTGVLKHERPTLVLVWIPHERIVWNRFDIRLYDVRIMATCPLAETASEACRRGGDVLTAAYVPVSRELMT